MGRGLKRLYLYKSRPQKINQSAINEWMGNLFKLKVMFTMLLFKNLIVNAQTWFLHNVSFKLRIMEKTSNWLSFLTLCPFTLPLLVEVWRCIATVSCPIDAYSWEHHTDEDLFPNFTTTIKSTQEPKQSTISFQCNESWSIRLLQTLLLLLSKLEAKIWKQFSSHVIIEIA